jgi:hypothetical protein
MILSLRSKPLEILDRLAFFMLLMPALEHAGWPSALLNQYRSQEFS